MRSLAHTISLVHLAASNKEPYLKGFKSLALQRDAGITLVSSQPITP